jgi:4-aminobutyrate aminotransferase/(S)-3-amino-2-methylpropionate transaminase
VALAVLEIIESEGLCQRAQALGDLFRAELKTMAALPALAGVIGDVHGLGAMIAMELVQDGDADRPDPTLTKALVMACAERGLVILACGVRGNVIRFLAPLTASDEIVREGMGILRDTLVALRAKQHEKAAA